MQNEFLALKFLAIGEMLKIASKLAHGPLNLVHFFMQPRDVAAQFDRVSAEEDSTPQQFKELLPHGGGFPKFDSSCGVRKREDAPF